MRYQCGRFDPYLKMSSRSVLTEDGHRFFLVNLVVKGLTREPMCGCIVTLVDKEGALGGLGTLGKDSVRTTCLAK